MARSAHRGGTGIGHPIVALAVLLLAGAGLTATPVEAGETEGAPSESVEVGTADWRQVSAGLAHTCGIRTSGRLYCWGDDGDGQLGDGGPNTDRSTPTQVDGDATDWVSVSVGSFHTCARRATRRLYCWGSDAWGQLGTAGANTDRTIPTPVYGGATTWASVTAGHLHTCARKTTGRLYCWGSDLLGQLGDGGSNTHRAIPTEVNGARTDWAGVSAGAFHTCARTTSRQLRCWGDDGEGRLGDGGSNAGRTVPTPVSGGATNWASVDAGSGHTCGRKTTGRLFCWGDDSAGQLGDSEARTPRTVPTPVYGGATDWVSVTTGNAHTCARKTSGRLYCWGSDGWGQLGDGGANTDRATPTQVAPASPSDWRPVSGGDSHTCARRATGRLYCWGSDQSAQLGNGSWNIDQSGPTEVAA